MLATVRAAKSQGSGSLFVRFRNSTGQYWNYASASWSAFETLSTKTFLAEYQDSDPLESRYQAVVSAPSGGVTAEYVQDSNGRVLAEEGDGYSTERLALDIVPVLGRIAALGGANRVVDQEVMDGSFRVISARIRTYSTAASASASGTLGLLATYTVSASYGPNGATTMIMTEQLP